MTTIYYAGDSTVQYNGEDTYPQTGLGQVLDRFLAPDIAVSNHGKNGRSTKSFLDEFRLAPIYDKITEGDFLFIQFGHNDEKSEDPARYTIPEGSFQENLEKFVNAARNKKAYPVFISPLTRRIINQDGSIEEDKHVPYTRAMEELAERLKVPFIDLNRLSLNKLIEAGYEETEDWYMNLKPGEFPNYPEGQVDNTHLREKGALIYAELIADALSELGGVYAALIK